MSPGLDRQLAFVLEATVDVGSYITAVSTEWLLVILRVVFGDRGSVACAASSNNFGAKVLMVGRTKISCTTVVLLCWALLAACFGFRRDLWSY